MISDLKIQLEESISKNANDFEISKLFKSYFRNYLKTIDKTLDESIGKDFFVKHTKHTDKFLILLYKYILRKHFGVYQPMSTSIPITLVALGSYGREQLCIYSDVDLLILYEDIKGYNLKEIMEEFITLAWDCGLKLGSRVHELKEIEESVKKDITIKSSILESRIIYGSKYLWFAYENVLRKIRKSQQKEFVLAKLEEHKKRLIKYPLKMEPNIKDGFGGMRESNMIFWMATVIYGVSDIKHLIGIAFDEEEYRKYRSSLEYIFQVRNALHYIAKRKLDNLNFDILPEISSKLKFEDTARYTKERQCMSSLLEALHNVHFFSSTMVKKFTRTVLFDSSNITTLKKYRYKKDLYIIENGLFTSFNRKAKSLSSLLKELIELPQTIDYFDRSYIYFVSKTKIPNYHTKELKRLIKNLLQKRRLHPIIKLIYNAGLFQVIIPITKKIINQPQFDGYHQHPVDIHSIKTLKKVENIEDKNVKKVYESLDEKNKTLVKLVALLHDVGKGRTVDHHIAGEKLFKEMAISLNLDENHINRGALIIRNHNMMSMVSNNEDIYSENVILKFTALVKDKLNLKILYVVTYADISAVGENIYKSSSAQLLQTLYTQCLPAFENKELLNENARRIAKQNTIKKLKKYETLPILLKKKINKISSNQIFLKLKAEDILDIAIHAYSVKTYTYKIVNTSRLKIKIIRKVPLNLGFLLGKLEFLNIASMNIFKLYDNKKAFNISFSEKIDDNDITYVEEIIKNSFDMERTTKLLIPTIKKENIKIDCNHTAHLVSMHITTKDQKGLFAYISKIFDDFGIEIESAKLTTVKGYAKDLILIEKNGNFLSNQEEILNLLCIKDRDL